MKSVILAGGEGSRLRLISGGLPKPMMPILGRPLLEHIINWLDANGVGPHCLSLRCGAEGIMAHFGPALQYRVEREPLGTAGGVKNCMDFVGGEDFLVVSGDAACDFDLAPLMALHRERGAAATIALCARDEPTRYGLALSTPDGRITGFIEKPGWERVVTDMVSTGIYVVSPAAMALVPEGRGFDFARDLFPLLLERGLPIMGEALTGYWCDIGTPEAYYRSNLDALEGLWRLPGAAIKREAPQARETPEETLAAVIPCRSRARLMRALAENLAEFGADFTRGLRLETYQGGVHISPLPHRSALGIQVFPAAGVTGEELSGQFAALTRQLEQAL